ncbi:MAG: dihydroorotate dehydrogenase [Magnetococcales bacterium]|nr:dihydroorotate dehydrogenase [Magnetococcales bacterium]MBF0321916.1 dihydroorotate dehydrogenase [Magnetococcales bacterium]
MDQQQNIGLHVSFAGLTLATPLVLLSGCVGFGEDLLALEGFDFSQIGAICLKGTTLEPRRGNPPHRLAETTGGLLNAIGLQNPGARHVTGSILPRLLAQLRARADGQGVHLIANVAGATTDEYAEVARIFDDSPVAALEINISCPNVKEGGMAFGSDPRMAAQVVAAVRRVTRKPIITKLSPNVTSIRTIARAALEAGTDAFAAINTLTGMAIDRHTRRPVLANVTGGLSGAAIKPVALLKVWEVYQEVAPHHCPIIGQGGVVNADDAVDFLIVGATAVGLGTVLFRHPLVAGDINQGMHSYLNQHNLKHVGEVTGTLRVCMPP